MLYISLAFGIKIKALNILKNLNWGEKYEVYTPQANDPSWYKHVSEIIKVLPLMFAIF